MTQEEETTFRFNRIKLVLADITKIIRPLLSRISGGKSGGVPSKIAGELLERILANCSAALYLIEPYKDAPHLAIPLSQIYRTMLYESVVSYWLYSTSSLFDERFKLLNADYIKKMSSFYREVVDDNAIQGLFKRWSAIAPLNFASGPNGRLELAKYDKRNFSDVVKDVNSTIKHKSLESAYSIYIILSQQAHVSGFSKSGIDTHYGQVEIFDGTTNLVVDAAAILLNNIPGADKEYAQMKELEERIEKTVG